METRNLKKIDYFVAGYGVLICCAAFCFFSVEIFTSALVGAVVALANWMGFRWAGIRMAATGEKSRFALFLGVKTIFILGMVGLVLASSLVEPLPFMIGLSSLVLGVLTKGALQALAEGDAALKEGQ